MRNHKQCAAALLQVLLKPYDRIIINMVRRLIQNEQFARVNQSSSECYPLRCPPDSVPISASN